MTASNSNNFIEKDTLELVRLIVQSNQSRDAKLMEVCRLLNAKFAAFDWVGFYLSNDLDQTLILGPYIGLPTEHVRIPFGCGICGQAAVSHQTINVSNVTAESNYLACSLEVRSEIVIPIIKSGKFVGELDLDSHRSARFDTSDQQFLEQIVQIVSALF